MVKEKKTLSFPLLLIEREEKKIITNWENWKEIYQRVQEENLSLRCVNPTASPPVYKLEEKAIVKKSKKPPQKTQKERIIAYNIGDNDLRIRLNQIQKWTEAGLVVKVNVVWKGWKGDAGKSSAALEKCHQIIADLQSRFPKIKWKDERIYSHLSSHYFFLFQKKHN